jgi:hypothetical protein
MKMCLRISKLERVKLARKKKERGFGGTFDNVGGGRRNSQIRETDLPFGPGPSLIFMYKLYFISYIFIFTKIILYKFKTIIPRNCSCYAV